MEFKANPLSIEDCLGLKRKYIIPRFQREYSWESDELQMLWEDLWDNIKWDQGVLRVQEYFLGSLVLVGDDDASNMERYVVDGQQRLMTFTIVLSVLSRLFSSHGEERLAKATFLNVLSVDNDGNDYVKLLAETPKPYFQQKVQTLDSDVRLKPSSAEEQRIHQAYSFFERRLEESALMRDLSSKYVGFGRKSVLYSDVLRAFRDQILACKVVYVTVRSFEDAYAIFEVLNAKGKNLTSIDMIKNTIFSVLRTEVPLDYAADTWAGVRSDVSSSSDDMSTFFRHYWLSKYSFSTAKNLVREFGRCVEKSEKSYRIFLDDLRANSEIYGKITTPNVADWDREELRPVYEGLCALDAFSTTQVRTFLLALFDAKRRNVIRHKTFLGALNKLEGFHFIFTAICSARASGLERKYSSYARRLRGANDSQHAHDVLQELFASFQETLPSYKTYAEKFCEIEYTSKKAQKKLLVQYILKKYDALCAQTNELVPYSFTIEHVVPESSSAAYVGMIGNLLPLSSALNSQIGNNDFEKKIAKFEISSYASVKEFCELYRRNASFGKREILDRTQSMGERLYEALKP